MRHGQRGLTVGCSARHRKGHQHPSHPGTQCRCLSSPVPSSALRDLPVRAGFLRGKRSCSQHGRLLKAPGSLVGGHRAAPARGSAPRLAALCLEASSCSFLLPASLHVASVSLPMDSGSLLLLSSASPVVLQFLALLQEKSLRYCLGVFVSTLRKEKKNLTTQGSFHQNLSQTHLSCAAVSVGERPHRSGQFHGWRPPGPSSWEREPCQRGPYGDF